MIGVEIEIEDLVSDDLDRMNTILDNRDAVLDVVGVAGERVLQDHFLKKDQTGNKRGFTRKHFWAGLAYMIGSSRGLSGDEAVLTIKDVAFNSRMFGGTIEPKRGKYLALPETDRAYQAGAPSEGVIADLFLVFRKKPGQPARAVALATGDKEDPVIQYWLVDEVTVDADPTALPEDDAFEDAAQEAIDDLLEGLSS